MELNVFIRELKVALIERGISEETAARHVANLSRTFTSDDLSEIGAISSSEEIEQLADSISVILQKSKNKSENVPIERVPARDVVVKPPKPEEKRIENRVTGSQKDPREHHDAYYTYSDEKAATTKGMLIFWVGLFLTLPISLSLLAAVFGVFAAAFIFLAALIVAGIVALIAIVAVGAGASLIGIIFGITQLFSFLAAGIYEIGLGIMIAGAVLFVSILIYNLSVRFFPWIITLVGNLLGFTFSKLKELFFIIRRECYKL